MLFLPITKLHLCSAFKIVQPDILSIIFNLCLLFFYRGTTSTPVHQPLPPAMALTPPNMNNSRVCQNNSFEDQTHRTPLRRSSSPNLSPSKRLFHSPPLTSSAKCPQPPRPSSTPAQNSRVSQNSDFEVTVSIFDRLSGTTTSEDEAEVGSPQIIKPSPIRLNPGFDPVWRPF
mgnify:CR=1 FL=1